MFHISVSVEHLRGLLCLKADTTFTGKPESSCQDTQQCPAASGAWLPDTIRRTTDSALSWRTSDCLSGNRELRDTWSRQWYNDPKTHQNGRRMITVLCPGQILDLNITNKYQKDQNQAIWAFRTTSVRVMCAKTPLQSVRHYQSLQEGLWSLLLQVV